MYCMNKKENKLSTLVMGNQMMTSYADQNYRLIRIYYDNGAYGKISSSHFIQDIFSLVISCWLQFCVPCFVYQTLVSITSFLVHCCFILVREETSMIQKLHACISKHSCFVHLVLLFATIPRVFVINNNNKVNLVDPMLRECSMWNKYR